VVRDPFERIVSAYLDKFAKLPPPGGPQQKRRRIAYTIKQTIRKTARASLIPTFEEFVNYVIITWKSANLDEEKMMELVNMHWKPVYINCGPCKQRYDIIMKMETLSRDTQYLKDLLHLNIDIKFTHHQGLHGHTSNNITVEYFKQLSRKQKNNLLQMYKLDFELFGYDWRKYFTEDRSEK